MTLVKCQSKLMIILNVHDRLASNIKVHTISRLNKLLKHLLKTITLDSGKEFANWKQIVKENDIAIYFLDVSALNQRRLNENCNGLLRKDGLKKLISLDSLSDSLVQDSISRRNHISRKLLNYKTPIEVFKTCISDEQLMSLA